MEVTLQQLPVTRVAYLHQVGPYDESIGRLWQKFMGQIQALQLPFLQHFGISYDNPLQTPPEQCRYATATEVGADFIASGELQTMEIPGGLYACAEFYGLPNDCGPVWQDLLTNWLPNSDYVFDCERAGFEHYLPTDRFDEQTGAFSCRLCAPVKARN
ncbi:GyrI-like domain-containing protein [Chitinibacter bivalviorum]|uniref:GyrI-like domain-containing protein n=1 Tax=Chitinibacter bivalviorum TaxID=2739434 RepID=A0A7H9BJU2_9NEIS|nr:GyrI-like domain-containing protein [Chitinibacter bivalviorum]QLG88518.1 GyrI-like domain-containing protein [Chitinibacter bivalviorum]